MYTFTVRHDSGKVKEVFTFKSEGDYLHEMGHWLNLGFFISRK